MSLHRLLPPEYRALPATAADMRWMDLIVDELHGWPKHSGTKHVSIITGPDGRFRSLGFNGLPRGLDDGNPAFSQHPLKREMTMCAERNDLLNLATIGLPAKGCTLYSDAIPCSACATAIVDAGISTVVMVKAEVHSNTHGDGFWRTGLETLLSNGIEIRQYDPAIARYQVAVQKIYHPPIASGSVDWDSRFLSLAQYLEGWHKGGTGEVIARRPSYPPAVDDKIVRALGSWSKRDEADGALEVTQASGASVSGCTLYLSNPKSLTDGRHLAENGITHVILPDKYRAAKSQPADLGVSIGYHRVIPQDYASLVRQQHPDQLISITQVVGQNALVKPRNEDTNHVV